MNRQPKGQSTGGQFAPSMNPESSLDLVDVEVRTDVVGEVLIRGDVMVELEDIGEGLCGDYDPDDPTDISLLRFTVLRKDGAEWEPVDDASYCTYVPSATSTESRQRILAGLMSEFHDSVVDGSSVKKLGERLSWIDEFSFGLGPSFAPDPSTTAILSRQDDYIGEVGNNRHPTRFENGTLPTSAIADLPGVMGETPGGRRAEGKARDPAKWRAFVDDIRVNGIKHPIFITVNYHGQPKISEGNHRRDAALELGLTHVPVEVRYFGHAEQKGSIAERAGIESVLIEKTEQP